jgi:hypothetical protein
MPLQFQTWRLGNSDSHLRACPVREVLPVAPLLPAGHSQFYAIYINISDYNFNH